MREPVTIGPAAVAARVAPAGRITSAARGRAWDAYLLAAIALAPIVVPAGPAQTAFVDALNAAAIVAFSITVAVRRPALRLPFALPVLLVATGSLLALTSAPAPGASVLALAQDAYLYLWFLVLVNLWSGRGALERFRIGWVLVADAIALACLVAATRSGPSALAGLVSARGVRWAATFYNPNMFADYLVLSVFLLLSLEGRLTRTAFAGSLLLLGVALLLTKSNGGLVALAAGLVVWAVARALARGVAPARAWGALAVLLGVLVVAAWTQHELHWADRPLERLRAETFVGRASRSTERRERIWAQLEETVESHPLGIGPAGSAEQSVAIGERERPGSFRSKEAHSDYIAAWVERGALGFVGLLLAVVESLRRIGRAWRRAGASRGGARLVLAALAGGLVATAVHSTVIEKLHFRHFWVFLALASAIPEDERS